MTVTLTAVPYVAATSTVRTNLVTNPRVVGSTGWAYYAGAGGAATLTPDTVPGGAPILATDGSVFPDYQRLVYQQTTASTGAGGVYWTSANSTVTPGVTYTASAYLVGSPTIGTIVARIVWLNASAGVLGSSAGTPVTANPSSSGYGRLSATGTAPANATAVRLEFYSIGAIPAGTSMVFTAILFEAASGVLPYFDGSTTAPVGSLDAWAGVANASVSTRTTRSPAPAASVQSTPVLLLDYGASRESASVAQWALGRPDPVHVLGPLRTRSGRLDLFYANESAAWAAVDLHAIASRVMLRDTERSQLDMYYVPRTVSPAPEERAVEQRWRVTVEYTEVLATAAVF